LTNKKQNDAAKIVLLAVNMGIQTQKRRLAKKMYHQNNFFALSYVIVTKLNCRSHFYYSGVLNTKQYKFIALTNTNKQT